MSYKIAGIDVHKKVLMVVVVEASTPEWKPERRRFATLPSDLRRLSTWLREQGVEEAVMESTAQYWRSVWLELEPYMRLHLAQAFSNRAPRGRKHDFKDAERLVRRQIAGELVLSFVPDGEQRTWRTMTRMKTQLRRDRVRLQNQMECLLEERCGSSCPVWSPICWGSAGFAFCGPWLVVRRTRSNWRPWEKSACSVPRSDSLML